MENTEPGMKHNLDISKLLGLETSSYDAMKTKYCNLKLLRMLEEGLHPDVAIHANGGSIKAHKSVLVCVSPVFEAMFEHSMQEQLTSSVHLPDISIHGVQLLLVLLYVLNDYIVAPPEFDESINEHFDELAQACCKYQVRRLGRTIATKLKFHLTPESCWDYFHQTFLMGFSDYYLEWWSYMLKHYKEVIESERFISEMERNPEIVQVFLQEHLLRTTLCTKK